MAGVDQLKMEELDHEAYESENLQDTNDFTSGDNGAGDTDSMMEDPVSVLMY
jgi:hypothetical protein